MKNNNKIKQVYVIITVGLILWCNLIVYSQEKRIYKIAIVEFQNNSGITLRPYGNVGPDQLGRKIADDISYKLAKEKEFKILTPPMVEEKIVLSLGVGKGFYTNQKLALKAGQILNCDFIVGGEIYNIKFSLRRGVFSKSMEAKLKTKLYLVNANSGEIVYITMLEGKGRGKAKFYSDLNKREIIVKAAAELSNKVYENIVYFINPEKMIEGVPTKVKEKPKMISPLHYYSEGIRNYLNKNYENCIKSFQMLLKLSPDNIFAEDAQKYLDKCERWQEYLKYKEKKDNKEK